MKILISMNNGDNFKFEITEENLEKAAFRISYFWKEEKCKSLFDRRT